MAQKPERWILHCDCNAFYASVEETFRPDLRLVPMAVAGDTEMRHGIILAKNELAKKYGIQTAETVWSAKQKCPQLVLTAPRHKAYSEFCERVNAIYEAYTPYVERFGIDESFLDVSGSLRAYNGDVMALANEIREKVKSLVHITISVGVSFNKIFAKLGSDYKKPDAVTLISRENYKEIVFPLPVGDLFFVGSKTSEALGKMGIRTIGELADCEPGFLISKFGKIGEQLYRNANGLDESRVAAASEGEAVKSVGNGYTFKRDLTSEADIKTAVGYLADSVATRLRKSGLKCRTVQLAIKDNNLKSITRQTKLRAPTQLSRDIADAALMLIAKHWDNTKPIRALTITGENLAPADIAEPEQLSFLSEPDTPASERTQRLEKAIDEIRDKYGSKSVLPGSILGNDLGIREK